MFKILPLLLLACVLASSSAAPIGKSHLLTRVGREFLHFRSDSASGGARADPLKRQCFLCAVDGIEVRQIRRDEVDPCLGQSDRGGPLVARERGSNLNLFHLPPPSLRPTMSSRRSGRVPDVFPPPQSAPSKESSLPNSWVSNVLGAVRWDRGNFKTQKVDIVCFGSPATSSSWEGNAQEE
ncbi:hypothetical protein K438DRAFT_1766328 [Mycena galopus ATCC 62051]|nr:hypothetical protein K438DRAFT_1766328 [Mycena galopus ATCC 62051]